MGFSLIHFGLSVGIIHAQRTIGQSFWLDFMGGASAITKRHIVSQRINENLLPTFEILAQIGVSPLLFTRTQHSLTHPHSLASIRAALISNL